MSSTPNQPAAASRGGDKYRRKGNMPNWTNARSHERSEGRAARVTALYLLSKDGKLPDIPKTQLAARLGISRWTLDRDLASVKEVDGQIAEIMEAITE